ncbi:MAG: MFS transporter [Thermoleophilia bacterium]|nr:MFS transporter [Thermoleophilia bacterium]
MANETGAGHGAAGTGNGAAGAAAAGAGLILFTLATGQFLMALDSSVMNVSIATVADDLGTTVTGVQTAITLYTLVMASLMILGGKIGAIMGRKRAFSLGCIIYGCGSLTTALAPNLTVLLIGWSFLEGIGAVLIMPAIVGLVAANFPPAGRPRAYGLIAAAAAIAIAVGPVIGGFMTTYFSWRYVFAGEVVIVLAILVLARRAEEEPAARRPHLDLVGVVVSSAGLALLVLGVLKSSTWGWVLPKAGATSLLGLSLTIWFILDGLFLLWLFLRWQRRLERAGKEPLVAPSLLAHRQLSGGLVTFLFQFLIQAGVFFTVPLFLSVVLGLSPMETGLRLVPLSLALLLAATGVPRVAAQASPRRIVRIGLLALVAGILLLIAGLEVGADSSIVFAPMIVIGFGIGALASQLGNVTVSAVPTEQSSEVGGLQNTASQLGASLGTALAGSVLIAALTASFLTGIDQNPNVPQELKDQANVNLAAGAPFISNAEAQAAMKQAGVPDDVAGEALGQYETSQIDGLRAALAVLAVIGVIALFFTGRIPEQQPGSAPTPALE